MVSGESVRILGCDRTRYLMLSGARLAVWGFRWISQTFYGAFKFPSILAFQFGYFPNPRLLLDLFDDKKRCGTYFVFITFRLRRSA